MYSARAIVAPHELERYSVIAVITHVLSLLPHFHPSPIQIPATAFLTSENHCTVLYLVITCIMFLSIVIRVLLSRN